LNQWQAACIELEEIEKQGISEPTKRTVLKNMLPVDLIRDLERHQNMKTLEKAWHFVLEQCPLRKAWSQSSGGKKNGPTPMDLDVAEEEIGQGSSGDDGHGQCSPCGEGELDTLKGRGKVARAVSKDTATTVVPGATG
jgi:hypothetical protein